MQMHIDEVIDHICAEGTVVQSLDQNTLTQLRTSSKHTIVLAQPPLDPVTVGLLALVHANQLAKRNAALVG